MNLHGKALRASWEKWNAQVPATGQPVRLAGQEHGLGRAPPRGARSRVRGGRGAVRAYAVQQTHIRPRRTYCSTPLSPARMGRHAKQENTATRKTQHNKRQFRGRAEVIWR